MNRPVSHEPLAREEPSATTGARLRRVAGVLCVAGAVVLADQATKAVVRDALNDGRVIDLFGGLIRLDYTRNTGAAFGLYQSGGVIFAVAAVLASAGIVGYAWRASKMPLAVSAGLGLILGGALGNLIDRVHLGYVVDFIDLRWWPVFNLADSCIVIGVSLLVLRALLAGDGRAAP